MSVKYRAVHENVPWKRVGNHTDLDSAINGDKGARKIAVGLDSYSRGLWAKRGKALCVFVWDVGAMSGYAFRANPASPREVQSARLPVDLLEQYDEAGGCSLVEIERLFDSEVKACAQPTAVEPENDEGQTHSAAPVSAQDQGLLYPDELRAGAQYPEGLPYRALLNAYERSVKARVACIGHYKAVCQVCGMDFVSTYGSVGTGFIHVHHTVPIASIGKAYEVDPINDLVPVCPNCHAMLHRKNPPYTVDEMRRVLKARRAD